MYFYLRPCCDLAVQRGLSVRWLARRETLRLSDWRPSLGNVMVQTPEIRIKERLINPNEKRCPACDGSGVLATIQPVQPGRRIYPPPCGECDGRGRIPKADK